MYKNKELCICAYMCVHSTWLIYADNSCVAGTQLHKHAGRNKKIFRGSCTQMCTPIHFLPSACPLQSVSSTHERPSFSNAHQEQNEKSISKLQDTRRVIAVLSLRGFSSHTAPPGCAAFPSTAAASPCSACLRLDPAFAFGLVAGKRVRKLAITSPTVLCRHFTSAIYQRLEVSKRAYPFGLPPLPNLSAVLWHHEANAAISQPFGHKLL